MSWWFLGIGCACILLLAIVSMFVNGFWSSLWSDIKEGITKHWLKFIGILIIYLGPLAFFLVAFLTTKTETTKIVVPVVAYIVAIPLLIIYWFRLRKAIDLKLSSLKAVNEVQEGKHYAFICLMEALKQAMMILTFVALYFVVNFLENTFKQASSGILVFVVFSCLGGVLCILDASFSYAKKEDIKTLDNKKEKKENNGASKN